MLRRNGKPRSCEPCRISKIRCDHEEPVCQKCRARGIVAQCFYHPAPMTKPAGTPRKQSEHRRRVKPKYSDTRESRDHETQFSITSALRSDSMSMASPSMGSALPTPPESATRSTIASEPPARSFYLGSTSYASVFAEEGPIPDSMHAEADRPVNIATVASDCPVASPLPPKSTKTRFCQHQVGHSIISKMAPFSLIESMVKMYFTKMLNSALESQLLMSALPQLRADLEQLSKAGSDTLDIWAEMTRNTTRPLKVPSTMTASEFHTLYTGRNLRWETLGLVLIIAGMNAQFTSPDDPIFLQNGRKIDKDEFIEDMIHASNECIHLCQAHGAVNDIMVWLMYHNMLAISNFYGDNYHGVWRRLSDCISTLFAEGIHCESSFGRGEPFFLREMRRKMFSAIYRSDKTMSTFLGRPPMMAWRYTDRPMPLDLDDNISASDPEVLEEALSKLDSDGWNTEGKIYTASWLRVRYKMSMLKERMLEQSIVGVIDPNVVENLQAISTNLTSTWTSLPPHLRYDLYHPPESAWTANPNPQITLRMIGAYLEYLHMDFQIHRILRRERGPIFTPPLLEISMRLLQTTLVFNKQRSQTYSIQRHFPTLILMYCLPSAGVLALELRRCTRDGVHMPGDVRRADVIRNLSVLISCLEWVVLPGDGNHQLCSELNKMLALVLDEVLNHQPVSNQGTPRDDCSTAGGGAKGEEGVDGDAAAASTAAMDDGFFNMPLIEGMEPIPTESEDFLNWLDNANWNNTYLF